LQEPLAVPGLCLTGPVEHLEDAPSVDVQWDVSTLRAITLRLDPEDYGRLESEAARLGVAPATLVRMYVRARFDGDETEAEKRRRAGLQALDRLTELTVNLPFVDAVQTARESREELDRRPGH